MGNSIGLPNPGDTEPTLEKSAPIAGAIVRGDCAEVERLVQVEHADPNAYCCERLEHGLSVRHGKEYHYTPLSLAVVQGKADVVQKLLSLRGDPNKSNLPGSCPVVIARGLEKGGASVTNMKEILNILEEQGADMTAKQYEVGEVVEVLLSKGLTALQSDGSGVDLQDDGAWPKKGKIIEKCVVPFVRVGESWLGYDQRDQCAGMKIEIDGGETVLVPGALYYTHLRRP
eukprot:TRINITY_DN49762_c0_g1_i1.p1 TRINITY_DN49762_c0_g1~~TRINITY_DN49762_c0_g1_i1.p1  ORF type:complete len:229 (-),score=23.80 TRINITY_DN49762_c0_g1_i1:137-823(-)